MKLFICVAFVTDCKTTLSPKKKKKKKKNIYIYIYIYIYI